MGEVAPQLGGAGEPCPASSYAAAAPLADAPTPGASPGSVSHGRRLRATAVAAAISGLAGRLLCFPLDVCKAKMQVHVKPRIPGEVPTSRDSRHFSPVSLHADGAASTTPQQPPRRSLTGTFRHVLRTQGVRGLYAGLGIACVGSIPATCLYFTAFEEGKKLLVSLEHHVGSILGCAALSRRPCGSCPAGRGAVGGGEGTGAGPWPARSLEAGPQPRLWVDFVAGFMAEAVSCVLWVPIDVCKEQLQTQAELRVTNHRGNLDALRSVSRQGLRQLYRGYYATLLSFGPQSALYFLFLQILVRKGNELHQGRGHAAAGGAVDDAARADDRIQSGRSSAETNTAALTSAATGAAPTEGTGEGAEATAANSVAAVVATSTGAAALPAVYLLGASAMASAASAWATTPLDLVKLRLQVQRVLTASPPSAAPADPMLLSPFQYKNFFHVGTPRGAPWAATPLTRGPKRLTALPRFYSFIQKALG
eukprot:GHVT01074978.1.p1 GENE.GHVT01074978.1~~GHVT01074978.1.p1  ORF type:complete len:479 (-),score=98.44 GHVT01074978.1:1171-2607(-)